MGSDFDVETVVARKTQNLNEQRVGSNNFFTRFESELQCVLAYSGDHSQG